jgi:hypothetical protein
MVTQVFEMFQEKVVIRTMEPIAVCYGSVGEEIMKGRG